MEASGLDDFKVPPSLKLDHSSRRVLLGVAEEELQELGVERSFALRAELGILPLSSYVTSGKLHNRSEPVSSVMQGL